MVATPAGFEPATFSLEGGGAALKPAEIRYWQPTEKPLIISRR
jgi:hypothetical protein